MPELVLKNGMTMAEIARQIAAFSKNSSIEVGATVTVSEVDGPNCVVLPVEVKP